METFDFNNARWKGLNRKEKYDLALKFTGDSDLARKARDWGYKRLTEEAETTRITFSKDTVVLSDARLAKDRYKENRRILRDLGYTSKEADALKTSSNKVLDNYIVSNTVINNDERETRWIKMSKRVYKEYTKAKDKGIAFKEEDLKRYFDPNLVELIKQVNEDNGFDKNAKVGWATVYYWYTQGGTLEFWKDQLSTSSFNGNIYERGKELFIK